MHKSVDVKKIANQLKDEFDAKLKEDYQKLKLQAKEENVQSTEALMLDMMFLLRNSTENFLVNVIQKAFDELQNQNEKPE
ncbi:hypothetical protein [Paenibacillus thermotolerans]|uniref:hypothetical protein n=1 Tax=Paenibacillus thermotolerans TaxID=3027807 RepID=UPI002368C4CF|nr:MULTISPECIES: hypothetical protein [unclassified Paenibacillus]